MKQIKHVFWIINSNTYNFHLNHKVIIWMLELQKNYFSYDAEVHPSTPFQPYARFSTLNSMRKYFQIQIFLSLAQC